MTSQQFPTLGTIKHADDRVHLRVWAPNCTTVELFHVQHETYLPMTAEGDGYFAITTTDLHIGDRYMYRLDGEKTRPDPTSRSQPDGVHGASQLVDLAYEWQSPVFHPPSLRNSVFYEMHIGTYTPQGTFEAIIPHLPRLKALGITSLQLMPVAQFPGERNWGYDGVCLYAPHAAYGGVRGLQRLVDAAHQTGMAVYLDVVYNHLGPEGNYLWDYGPYFTRKYASPWGESVNFDDAHSDHVRQFFIQNALYWIEHYRIDGFRFDATHALLDFTAYPFLEALGASIREWASNNNRHVHLIAENDRSDPKLTQPRDVGGTGMDAQWLDDLHHSLHVALTGEQDGYYIDYTDIGLMAKIMRDRFAYTGQYSPNWQRRHGLPATQHPADRFIVASQTHDQVGNRMLGERLTQLTDFEGLKLAAGLLCTSPYTPMLFMGEEYGETAPFLYFIAHTDPDLVKAVQAGRKEEFAYFDWQGEPPDPYAQETFQRSKLDHTLRDAGQHAQLYDFYTNLLALRHQSSALTNPAPQATHVYDAGTMLCLERHGAEDAMRIVFNFSATDSAAITLPTGRRWRKHLDSRDWPAEGTAPDWLESDIELPPQTFVIYIEETPK